MNDSDSVNQFMSQIMNVVNQIKSNGEEMLDQKIIGKILGSLPSEINSIVVAIEESKDLAQLFVDKLMGSLLSHESRMNRNNSFCFLIMLSSLKNHLVEEEEGQVFRGRGHGRGGRSNSDQGERNKQQN